MSFKVKDFFFKKAKKENYYARSIYKLEEIDKKFHILGKGYSVLDLGYFPGSWVQYSLKKVGPAGKVVGIDIQEINTKFSAEDNILLFCKDVFELSGLEEIGQSDPFDIMVSDMAPKTTGIKTVDQLKSLDLVEKVFSMLPLFLKQGGNLVVKIFESQDAQNFIKENKKFFTSSHFFRPKATRSVSQETFFIGKGYKADHE